MDRFNRQMFDFERRNRAFDTRLQATTLSRDSTCSGEQGQVSNGDEQQFATTLLASFTKGLPHFRNTSIIRNLSHFRSFVSAINSGDVDEIAGLPLGPPQGEGFTSAMAKNVGLRAWESMAAGLAFSLQGPDSHRVTMPPAPQIDSAELAFEMSELYWMALLRDKSFADFKDNTKDEDILAAVAALNQQKWIQNPEADGPLSEDQRRHLRGELTPSTVFRGYTFGELQGPYLSQFLLVGNPGLGNINRIEDGFIMYGSVRIDQRVRVATVGRDYMTSWQAFIDVQNGADVRGFESYEQGDTSQPAYRFMATPRDLATYVHYDALYEAYLNACLIMLSMGIPFDKGIPFGALDNEDKQTGFALFGGPHILSLVTEVATRALKAVRYQKFNIHRRTRPEAVGGLIDASERQDGLKGNQEFEAVRKLVADVDSEALERIGKHNAMQNDTQRDATGPRSEDFDPINENSKGVESLLLPMAFPEGSPMHPSYGAGHGTVAGACVTILKAFFDMDEDVEEGSTATPGLRTLPFAFEPSSDGSRLVPVELDQPLTLVGELNKICANISIGRDWAGVHWYSDYVESIRLGEEIALGILREQKLTYNEDVSMTVPLFDGGVVTI